MSKHFYDYSFVGYFIENGSIYQHELSKKIAIYYKIIIKLKKKIVNKK